MLDAPMNIPAHLSVGETQHAIPFAFQPSLTLHIARSDVRQAFVDSAIDLDDQPPSMAGKVREIPADRRSAAKIQIELPQLLPETLLGARHPPLQPTAARCHPRRLPHMFEHHAFPPSFATQASAHILVRSRMRPM